MVSRTIDNHYFYNNNNDNNMDDIKLFAKNEKEMETLILAVRI